MPPKAGSRECTQNKLVSWKTQPFRNSLLITEANKLFDSTRVTLEGGISQTALDGLGNMVSGLVQHHKRVVADIEEGVRIRVLQGWLRETGSCWRLVVGRLRGMNSQKGDSRGSRTHC